jgi:hypothetical protein
MTVWKFQLDLMWDADDGGVVGVDMPVDARVLHVHAQGNDICLWAHVSPDAPLVTRHFTVTGTGHPTPRGEYVGTAHTPPDVWHVWELVQRRGDAIRD